MIPTPRWEQGDAAPQSAPKATSLRTVIIGLIVALIFLYLVRWIALPFVIAGVIAYLCNPLVDILARRAPRRLMAGLIFLGLLAAIAGLWLLGAPPLIREAGRIAGDFDGTMQRLATVLIGTETVSVFGRPMNASELAGVAVTGMQNWIARGDTLMNIAAWSFTAIFGFFLTLVLLFYFLIDGKRIGNGLFWLVPPAHRPFADFIWSKIDPVLKRYFVGVLAVVTYAAVAAYIGLGVTLGIHHAVFLALITGILEMIPIVGPASAIAIAGLVAIQQAAGYGTIIAYAIYATLLRLSIDQLIGPLVLGTAARLHPTLVIFCFLAGGVLFGIAGVILAVPAALATRIALAAMYEPARA